MKTETLLFVVAATMFFLLLLFPRLWAARSPHPLSARQRTLTVFISVLALVLVTAIVVRFALPDSAPGGLLIAVLAFQLICALLYRRHLIRQIGTNGQT
jgi:hypothetical protein